MTHHTQLLVAFVILASLGGCKESQSEQGKSAASSGVQLPSLSPSSKVYDGPFGLAMGISPKELVNEFDFKERPEIGQDVYIGKPPKPVAGMDEVMVLATKGQGLCRLIATSDVSVVNDTGAQLKAETDKLAEMIELKYGKRTKKYDFATQDVYDRNPEFWMMALTKDAVFYSYEWVSGQADLKLPSNIKKIEVSAAASRHDSGWARIAYTFANNDACLAEIKKQKAENL